jgi:glycosyltransferase involved in cell wall biosynthesis
VDDGSIDGTPEVIARYPAVRCLRQPNQGNAAGKNAGLAAARGELIAFLDADDLWLPGKLAAQAAALRKYPAAGFTVGRMAFFFEPGVARPAWVPASFLSEPQPAYLPSGMLARREVFARVGVFDPAYPIINDLDWLVRARDAGVSDVVTPEVVVRRRVHGANLTYRAAERAQELLRLMHASTRRKDAHPAAGPRL